MRHQGLLIAVSELVAHPLANDPARCKAILERAKPPPRRPPPSSTCWPDIRPSRRATGVRSDREHNSLGEQPTRSAHGKSETIYRLLDCRSPILVLNFNLIVTLASFGSLTSFAVATTVPPGTGFVHFRGRFKPSLRLHGEFLGTFENVKGGSTDHN